MRNITQQSPKKQRPISFVVWSTAFTVASVVSTAFLGSESPIADAMPRMNQSLITPGTTPTGESIPGISASTNIAVGPTVSLQPGTVFVMLDKAWWAHNDQTPAGNDVSTVQEASAAFTYADGSSAALDNIYALASRGNAEALNAFVILGPGNPYYFERSLQLLFIHAANGNTLALTTLAEWSASGFAFASRDVSSSIAFEYLAWLTGQWGNEDFQLSADRIWSSSECRRGIAMGQAFGAGKPWAVRLTNRDPATVCFSSD